jgi:hypothetical protein
VTEPRDISGAWVSATQVAAYAYCAESWRLAHGLGLPSRHTRQRQQGIAAHADWQDMERTSSRVRRLGMALMLLALAGLRLHGWVG